MVTHNPDIECYADRMIYISDGKIVSQALNQVQSRLNYEHYLQYLNTQSDSWNLLIIYIKYNLLYIKWERLCILFSFFKQVGIVW